MKNEGLATSKPLTPFVYPDFTQELVLGGVGPDPDEGRADVAQPAQNADAAAEHPRPGERAIRETLGGAWSDAPKPIPG